MNVSPTYFLLRREPSLPEGQGGLEKENREYKQKINALTKQLKGEQQYADEQDEAAAKINQEMEPFKKQNKQLMSIIGAAEKGHNLLLNTMQSINSEIAGNFK